MTETVKTSVTFDGDTRLIYLNDTVESSTVGPIIEQIQKWNEEDDQKDSKQKDFTRKPIKFVVNTYGGDAYDCFALCSVIELSKTPVYTYVYGKTMSAGLAIAACGHKRFGGKYSSYMYHGVTSMAWGKIGKMKEDIAETERIEGIYDTILMSKSNLRKADLQPAKDSRGEWYFGAEEALKVGLIDEIL